MYSFFTKRKLRRALYSKPTVALMAVVALFFGYTAWNAYSRAHDAAERRAEATARLSELEVRKEQLSEKIERLSTEEGVEAEIRQKYDVGRAGERVVVIVERKPDTLEEHEKAEPRGFFARILDWF